MKISWSYPSLPRNVEQNLWPPLNGDAFSRFNFGNVILSPYETGVDAVMHMSLYCFLKSPLTTDTPIYWKKQFFLLTFLITAVCLFLMKKSKVWEDVAWLRAGKGPLVSLSHEPCPSQCGDILNHTVGMWPCPWKASILFYLPSPCDGIIPAHLPFMKPIPGNTGTHSALLDPIVMLNAVHPHICQVQMFVGWHCAGSDVDGGKHTSTSLVNTAMQSFKPVKVWSWSVRWAGVCIKVAEALAHFGFPRSW